MPNALTSSLAFGNSPERVWTRVQGELDGGTMETFALLSPTKAPTWDTATS